MWRALFASEPNGELMHRFLYEIGLRCVLEALQGFVSQVPSGSPNRFTITVATAFCLWKRRLYLVEISVGQSLARDS